MLTKINDHKKNLFDKEYKKVQNKIKYENTSYQFI